MECLWDVLDCVPIVRTVKKGGEAVVALYEGDYKTGLIKVTEAVLYGFTDVSSLGTGAIATGIAKKTGKNVVKEVGKQIISKVARPLVNLLKKGSKNQPPSYHKNQPTNTGPKNQQSGKNNKNKTKKGNQLKSGAGGGGDKPPNDNGGRNNPPKRGHHVINNGIVKLLKKLIKKFLLKLSKRYLIPDRDGISFFTPHMQIYEDYYHTVPTHIERNIAFIMVVRNFEHLEDPNDYIYGNYVHELETVFLEYLMVIFDRREVLSNSITENENIARGNVNVLINAMIDERVFIDETARQYWINGGNRIEREHMFNEAEDAVVDMLRGLVNKAETWVDDIMQAFENYCTHLNKQQPKS